MHRQKAQLSRKGLLCRPTKNQLQREYLYTPPSSCWLSPSLSVGTSPAQSTHTAPAELPRGHAAGRCVRALLVPLHWPHGLVWGRRQQLFCSHRARRTTPQRHGCKVVFGMKRGIRNRMLKPQAKHSQGDRNYLPPALLCFQVCFSASSRSAGDLNLVLQRWLCASTRGQPGVKAVFL